MPTPRGIEWAQCLSRDSIDEKGVVMSITEDEQDGLSVQRFAHDVFVTYYPLVNDLQAAVKAAMEADDPLACACYAADKEGTMRELIAYFNGRAMTGPENEES
jgi:hypothetical protein